MWELDYKESWALKNRCFRTVVLEKTLESPLDCKEIQPVHSEGEQPWVFFGRNDAEAETAILWPPHVKSWLIGKDSDAGRDYGQEEKGTTEDEMAGWHHGLDGRESEWTPGVGDGQGGLACCDSWGHKEPDTTEQLNWTWFVFYTSHVLRSKVNLKFLMSGAWQLPLCLNKWKTVDWKIDNSSWIYKRVRHRAHCCPQDQRDRGTQAVMVYQGQDSQAKTGNQCWVGKPMTDKLLGA